MSRVLPILFNTEMVKSILDNRKSCTRRLVKPQLPQNVIEIHEIDPMGYLMFKTDDKYLDGWRNCKAPYKVGDILYVRETFGNYGDGTQTLYKADFPDGTKKYLHDDGIHMCDIPKWHPSIHMPKEASRIFLKVNDVRVERLQDITEEQAEKEGASPMTTPNIQGVGRTYIQGFGELWNSTVDKNKMQQYGWNANPYVWVIEFERCEKPEEGGKEV